MFNQLLRPGRRRWRIVAALAIAAIYFPRPKPDPRFVGRWVASSGPIEHIYQLNSDGSGQYSLYRHYLGYEPLFRLTWWTNGDHLVIRKSHMNVTAPIEDLVIRAYTTMAGLRNRRESSFDIHKTQTGLSLQSSSGFERLVTLEQRQGLLALQPERPSVDRKILTRATE